MAGKGFYSKVCLMVLLLTCSAFAQTFSHRFSQRSLDNHYNIPLATPSTGYPFTNVNDMFLEFQDVLKGQDNAWTTLGTNAATQNNQSFYISACGDTEKNCTNSHTGMINADSTRLLVRDNNNGFHSMLLGTQSTPPSCKYSCGAYFPLKQLDFQVTPWIANRGTSFSFEHQTAHADNLIEVVTDKLVQHQYAPGSVQSWTDTTLFDFGTCSSILPLPGVSYRTGGLHITDDDSVMVFPISKRSTDTTQSQYVAVYFGGGCQVLQTDTGVVSGASSSGTVTGSDCRFLVKEAEVSPWGGSVTSNPVVVLTIGTLISGTTCTTNSKLVWTVNTRGMKECNIDCGPGTGFAFVEDNTSAPPQKQLFTKQGANNAYLQPDVSNFTLTPTLFWAQSQAGSRNFILSGCGTPVADGGCNGGFPTGQNVQMFVSSARANGTGQWTTYCENEICGEQPGYYAAFGGGFFTLGHTMISGTNPDLDCARGSFVMRGAIAAWTSDNLGLWGTDAAGNPRCDIVLAIAP